MEIQEYLKHRRDIGEFSTSKTLADERGYYICADSVFYLHGDGVVHHGVKGDNAFWATQKEAGDFLEGWLNGGFEYRVIIHPVLGVEKNMSVTVHTIEQAELVKNATADLLLFLQDDLKVMDDYSNMYFLERRDIGGDWEDVGF